MAIGLQAGTNTQVSIAGFITGIGSALCWSLATLVNKNSKVFVSHWTLSFWQMLIGSLALLIIGFTTEQQYLDRFSTEDILWFIWLAIPGSAIAQGLWFKALTTGGATTTSGYLFLCPGFTILISFFMFGIPVSASQLVGGVLITLSLLLISAGSKVAAKA